MNATEVIITGNVVDEPSKRYAGESVLCSFRIASTERRFDRQVGGWVDGDSLFLRVTCWRALAGHVLASVHKGDPVMVKGRLFSRQYDKDGQKRVSFEIDAHHVGHDLTRGTSRFEKAVNGAPNWEVAEAAEALTAAAARAGKPSSATTTEEAMGAAPAQQGPADSLAA